MVYVVGVGESLDERGMELGEIIGWVVEWIGLECGEVGLG